jgi:ABC-type dipeptide/oligopeptide/nickel transport system permease subunit
LSTAVHPGGLAARQPSRGRAGDAGHHAAGAAKKGFIGFLRRNPTIAIGGFLVLLMVAVAIFAPFLWTRDPDRARAGAPHREPSAQWWFRHDMLGRDVYSRVLYGAGSR